MNAQVTNTTIVLEESYLCRRWLILVALVFAGIGFAPGVTLYVKEGTLLGFAIGSCLVGFVFYLPYFLVLAWSRYRRVEIDRATGAVTAHVVYRLRAPTVRQFAGEEVAEVVCTWHRNTEGPDGMTIALSTRDGEEVALINRAAWSDEVLELLRPVFGERVRRA